MKQTIKIMGIITTLLLLFGAGFGAGRMTSPHVVLAQTFEPPSEFEVFWQVWQIAHEHFIDRDKLNTQKMTYGAVNGVLDVLGDEGHTRFLPPKDAAQQKESISGKFYGIGATVNSQDGYVVIVAPIAGSPAEKAGIKSGDLITTVDGEDIFEMPLGEAIDLIKGDEGTEVKLKIYRPDNDEVLDFTIIRGEIEQPAAAWTVIPETEIGYIRLAQFSANLENNLLQAVEELKAEGATSLIIDVRNNPGGLLDQCIRVTSQFLSEGNVLLEEDAQGNRKAYSVQPNGQIQDLPIVVLINQGSASASEIFAGAIQDHKRGTVIGQTTFGTGTVLQPFDLKDGSTLLLGVSQWLTPQGRLIRQNGIEPDTAVELPDGTGMLWPGVVNAMTLSEMVEANDTQFLRALEELGVSLPEPPEPEDLGQTAGPELEKESIEE